MSSLTNEYERLLKVIDEEKSRSFESKSTIESINKEPERKESDEQEPAKKPQPKDYSVLDQQKTSTSSISESVKENFRRKLVDNYTRMRSYNRPYLSVSEIQYCIRKCYYERMKYPVDTSGLFKFELLYLIQEVGKKVHDLVSENFNFDEVEKVVKSEKYGVKGRLDAIKDNTLFEIKTVDVEKSKQVDTNHINQANIYAAILVEEYGYKIDNIEFVYIPRNLKNILSYEVKPDLGKGLKFLKNAAYLHDCLKTSIVPDTINKEFDNCDFCHFRKYCSKEENNDQENNQNKRKDYDNDVNTFLLGG